MVGASADTILLSKRVDSCSVLREGTSRAGLFFLFGSFLNIPCHKLILLGDDDRCYDASDRPRVFLSSSEPEPESEQSRIESEVSTVGLRVEVLMTL